MMGDVSEALSNLAVSSRRAASPRMRTASTIGFTFAIISSDLSTGRLRSCARSADETEARSDDRMRIDASVEGGAGGCVDGFGDVPLWFS